MPRSQDLVADADADAVLDSDDPLSATASHAAYCFSTLLHHYDGGEAPLPEFEHDGHHCPLFVTWDTVCRSSGDKSLRGCIGSLSPQPLAPGLRSYALTSALRDRRFSPVSRAEVPSLHCTVSLLRGFEEGLGWRDWVPGKHGIIVEFEEPESKKAAAAAAALAAAGDEDEGKKRGPTSSSSSSRSFRSRLRGNSTSSTPSPPSPPPPSTSNNRRRPESANVLSATYLPHVAPEQGWGVREAIDSLVRKAGFHGEITDALRRELRLTRYESSMAGLGWREFEKVRKEKK